MQQCELIATATFGLESIVSDEIEKLGYDIKEVANGKVTVKTEMEDICHLNTWLRTADRIRLKMGEFKALSFEELFEKTKELPWPKVLPQNACFPVEGKSVKSKLFSVPDCQAITKKAVVESMKEKYKTSWFNEDGALYKIEVALLKDTAAVTIDTTGPGLHKRGYRQSNTPAPLKETLAAAMIYLARWYPDTTLIDPFCGSGTIPIEAAMMGRNIAPGINRNFVSQQWPQLPRRTWKKAREQAADLADFDLSLDIFGTDISTKSVSLARKNARNAGVDDTIHFQQQPVSALSSKKRYGKIICNPPYGERLEKNNGQKIEDLYREIGRTFQQLETWSFYILTSHSEFEKLFGSKASKRRKLYNGNIKVHYY